MKSSRTKSSFLGIGVVWGVMTFLAGQAAASAITYTGSSGNLSASVTFSLTGNTLHVTLTNTSPSDVKVPQDVLTAVFFNTTHLLTPVSASLNGSTVFYGSLTSVGDGWGYYSNLGGGGHGKNDGITAVGLGIGDGHSNFSGTHHSLGGLDYGLLSAGDDSATGNTGVKGKGPLIKDSIEFTLTAPHGFKLRELGNTVVFQYGSTLSDSHFRGNLEPATVPEPGTLLIVGSGMLCIAGVLRRKVF
ncbi:MAG TPA: PEP-CTERM sorting domain-containing protein [Candidatus Eisenbacteria bacterium]|nr:PEP-CTERM sorting domain-containing protein [Candidatus Eisenbacteria bacterium]